MSEEASSSKTLMDWVLEVPFGLELPMGSRKGFLKLYLNLLYLNDGSGDPWTGQVKPIAEDTTSSKTFKELSLDAVFGLELPIGSIFKNLMI